MTVQNDKSAAGWKILLAQVTTLAVFLLLWEWASRERWIDPLFIGQPSQVFAYLYKALFVDRTLLAESVWTLWSTGVAFVLGSVAGIAFGLLFVLYLTCSAFSSHSLLEGGSVGDG